MNKKKRNSGPNEDPQNGKAPTEEVELDSAGNPIVADPGSVVYESGRKYVVKTGNGGYKSITNFIMKPVSVIEAEGLYLLNMEFLLDGGMSFVRQINSAALSSVPKFKAELKKISGLDMTFDGTEADLSHIQNFINKKYKDYDRCRGVNYVGLHRLNGNWVYVGTDGAIDNKGTRITNLVSALEDNDALDSGLIETDAINGDELNELSHDLFRFNTYERTISIIGWVSVCFFKERLRQRQIKMSHLVLAGGAGSGKSETLEKIIQPIFGLTGSGIGCKGLTNFSTLKSTSSTNLLPIIYEEFKPHKLNPSELNIISGLLRNTYDYQSSQRGKADQSVVSYIRRSPIILVGESSFDETAIKERIIDVQFAKSDRTEDHTRSYRALSKKKKLLNKLGKSLLLLAMNISDKRLDELIRQSNVFGSLDFETRVTQGVSNVKLGITLMKEMYKQFHLDFEEVTGITDKLVYDSLVSNTMNAMDGITKVRSAVDITLQVFDTMALKRKLWRGWDYIIDRDKNQLYLRINTIYDDFTKYIREFNITDIEVLSSRQFAKQLRKERYFVGYAQRDFKKSSTETERKRCYVLDLAKLNETCELEAFNLETEDDGKDYMYAKNMPVIDNSEETQSNSQNQDQLPKDDDGFIDVAGFDQEEFHF